MDLSKLPKLSQTRQHDPAGQPGQAAPIDYASRRYDELAGDGPLAFIDIFLAVGMGLLFVFMGLNYGKHLLGSKEAFPEITSTGYVWKDGHPKAGQPILPDELTPENRKAYDARILGRELGIVSESSLFLLGSGLVLAGLIGILAHLAFLNIAVRRTGAIGSALITAVAMVYALWAIVYMMRYGQMALMTMVALLVAGLSMFWQIASVRALMPMPATGGGAPTPGAGFGSTPIAGASTTRGTSGVPATDRIVHHRFAHQTLRKAVFADPATIIGVLQGAAGTKYLRDLWEATCHAAGQDPTANPPTGLESEMTQVGPYSAAIVTMPSAKERGEAAFIGVVLRSYVRQDGAVIERSPLVLYYALELDSPASTDGVLCEWQAGDHVKFADRMPIDFKRFREIMWAKVQARQEAEDRSGGA